MPDVKYKLTRGGTSGINNTPLEDGQILFDKEKRRISLDTYVGNTLTRVAMNEQTTFNGTTAEWNELTDAEKSVYTYVNITDDFEHVSEVMIGASNSTNGRTGIVPQPLMGDEGKVLYGDATWKTPSVDYEDVTNTPTLGTAAAKDSTNAVTEDSTDLVESGAVYDALAGKADSSDLGTAAFKNVPTSGDAGTTEVVMGDDSRLTDSRNAADVYSWAKAETKPDYSAEEVGAYTTTQVDNLISTLESGLDWKEAVATFDDIATTYPNPADGWTVNVKDTDYTYRYDGSHWVAISANAIPQATTSVNGLMTTTQVTKLEGAADKVANATSGNFAGLDSSGNLTDSGKKASDFLTSHQDISGKADKVSSATNGNFAGLNASGNLTDSGKKASDFAAASHNQASNTINAMTGYSKASTADQPVSTSDSLNTAIGKLEKTLDGKTSNVGTITGITMNGSSKGTSGVVDLGTVITSHQDISGKADKPTVKSQTLAASDTTVTFTGIPTSGNNLIDFFSSDGSHYTAINTATAGQITLTYTASSSARTIYCRIEGV